MDKSLSGAGLRRKSGFARGLLFMLCVAGWAFGAAPVHAAAQVQKANGSAVSATTVSASFAATATAGDMLIAIVGANGARTITGPAGWYEAINQSGTVSQGIFYKRALGTEKDVSATADSSVGSLGIQIYEYSGATSFMQASSATGNSKAPASGTVTTAVANELVVAGFTIGYSTAVTNPSWANGTEGFTEQYDFTDATPAATYAGGHNLASTAGARTVTVATGNPGGNWLGQIARFQNDTTAPAAVSTLALDNATSTSLRLTWTAPGDDGTVGTAKTYDIRYSTSAINDGNFASATQVAGEPDPLVAGTVQSMTVGSLTPGTTYYFAMKTSDEAPNVSALSNAPGAATLPPPDTTAPAAVSDLALDNATSTSLRLTWTAPGDDGNVGTATTYRIRYSTAPIDDSNYGSAALVPGAPAPQVAGTVQSMTVGSLTPGTTYYFAMKTQDEVPNVSAISNLPGAATLPPPDTTAPAAVSDLALDNATSTSLRLTWTAPGDDGNVGTAASYDVRYSNAPITTDGDFSAATQVAGEPAPAVAGTVQSMTVGSLTPGTTYYFAMKTQDEVPNVSALSNAPGAATLPPPDTTAPAAIGDLALSNPTTSSIRLTWTAPGDDGTVGTASLYDIHYSTSPITNDADYDAAADVSPSPPAPAVAGTVQSMTVTGLAASTTYYFAIKTHDEVPNISALSNAPGLATSTPADTTAPAAVSDLALDNATSTSLRLTWTAPGDDGAVGTANSFDIRYSTSAINDGNFASATQVAGEPAPQVAGTVQSMTVGSLAANTTYYFAMKTADEAPNVSAISNLPSLSTLAAPDTTAPSAVSDLALSGATSTSITLTWTAPGDDGNVGTAASYDIRYSDEYAITTDVIYDGADLVTGEPAPAVAGTVQSMTVTGLTPNTNYHFALKTSDDVSNVSTFSNSPSLSTLPPPDTTAPAAITTLALSGATSSAITLTWTAPGDDGSGGTASFFDIRYSTSAINDGNFASATQVTGEPAPQVAGTVQSMTVGSLAANTTYYFAMKTGDEVPNVSAVSNVPSLATQPSADTTVPAAVSDLALDNATSTSLRLTWTAPGDDGNVGTAASYDIRYSTSAINGNWASATPVAGEPAPQAAGTVQSMTVSGLAANTTYYFAMKTQDEAPNESAISNVPSLATLAAPDTTAPAAVSDLALDNATSTSIRLTWTAPGDDGAAGTANSFDIRYSTSAINDGNFASATQVTGEPAPQVAGTVQSMTVGSLAANTTYYFAMKTGDEVPNVSAISNIPSLATLPVPDVTAPAAITTLALSDATSSAITLTWTAPGDDGAVGTANSYDIRYSISSIVTNTDFAAATQVAGEPVPQVAGTVQSMTVGSLAAGTTYHFAIKTSDEVPNISALSNVPSLQTTGAVGGGGAPASGSLADLVLEVRAAPYMLPAGGGKVTFTYHVMNLGNGHIGDIAVKGDLGTLPCAPTYVSGDSDLDGSLDPGTEWTYSCTTTVVGSGIHTAQASGFWNYGRASTPAVSVMILAGDVTASANLDFTATPYPSVLHAGGGKATLLYAVENLGESPLTDLRFSGDFCTLSALLEGDENANGILDPREKWEYSCDGTFTRSTDLEIVATAKADAVTLRDVAKVQIDVGSAEPRPSIHLTVTANPAKLPVGGGTTLLTYHVSNDGNVPLSDVTVSPGSPTCRLAAFAEGDADGDRVLGLGERWTYTCVERLYGTEADAAFAKGKAGDAWVTDDALFIVPVATSLPPEKDKNATGAYDPRSATEETPDINTALGLHKAEGAMPCVDGVPYKCVSDLNPDTQADSTVYYCGRDGKRHAFPSPKVFKSWYPDYANVVVLDRGALDAIPLGGVAVYRPGTRMVKRTTDAKVYAVARGGVLRWVETEAMAASLYGAHWASMIDDMPEPFWKDYAVGEPVK